MTMTAYRRSRSRGILAGRCLCAYGLAREPHPVASAVPAEPGTCSGSSRRALDRSAIRASPLIMVALLSTYSERAKVTMFSEVI